MVKQKAPERIYTTVTPQLETIRDSLHKLGYSDTDMVKEGIRCLARREGVLQSGDDLKSSTSEAIPA